MLGAKGEILQRKEGRELEREKEAKERRRLEDEIVGAGSKESRLLEGQYCTRQESVRGEADERAKDVDRRRRMKLGEGGDRS